jgi:signal transducing adaptor molecule
LKQEGIDFAETQTPVKREVQFSKDPNVVASQQEADDIAKAIELSLKEKTTSPKAHTYSSATSTSTSLYPSVNSIANPSASSAAVTSSSIPAPELRKVRTLYDFEAAEDNELTFKAGEIIMVIEESDPNWWRGSNHRGEGYFPANFVTADLSMEPEDLSKETKSSKKNVQFDNSHETQKTEQAAVEINEEAIDRLLFLLHEADPSDPSQDSDEMLRLENAVNQMGPLIDSELERVDRKHAQLTQLSSDLIDTINLYHSLMQTDTASSMYGGGFGGAQQMFRPPTSAMFPGASNPSFGAMMPPAGMGMNMGMPMPAGSQMHGYPQMNNFPPPQNHQQPPPMAPSGNFQMYQNPQQPPQQQQQQQQLHQMMPSQQQQQQQQMQPPMGMQMNPAMHPMNGLQHTAPLDQQQAIYMGAMYPPQQQQQQQPSIPMPGGNMAM